MSSASTTAVKEKPAEGEAKTAGNGETKKLKPCCACPEARQARDECIVLNGPENCATLIEAHRKCLRELGFEI